MNKSRKIIILVLSLLLLTGCSEQLKDNNNKLVTNNETGQPLTKNIICQPEIDSTVEQYEKYKVEIKKLPKCSTFTPVGNYEGLWTSIFVKPLAWLIIKIGSIVQNYGLALIITCLLLRGILIPFTRKTAMQSELMKKAQPELSKLEKKYQNCQTEDGQRAKATEMMAIYQKYKINPISGCLVAFIQLPLLIAFYEAIQRTPAIFEDKFLLFNLGTTPWYGIKSGEYIYILLVVLIFLATYVSFKKTLKDQSAQAGNMKFMLYFMLAIITYSSFTISSAVGIYWITSNIFTIVQNLLVERRKVTK